LSNHKIKLHGLPKIKGPFIKFANYTNQLYGLIRSVFITCLQSAAFSGFCCLNSSLMFLYSVVIRKRLVCLTYENSQLSQGTSYTMHVTSLEGNRVFEWRKAICNVEGNCQSCRQDRLPHDFHTNSIQNSSYLFRDALDV